MNDLKYFYQNRVMSNDALKQRIKDCIVRYRAGEAGLDDLISAVESNGAALENMPYKLIQEIDTIEYKLTSAKFDDEEGCESNPDQALESLECWLSKIPS